jgi:hypothetical protein
LATSLILWAALIVGVDASASLISDLLQAR